MQKVITAAQAKQITGGRTPLVPVEYEEAIRALTACRTLDEAKYWSDKADALAAWAKIYHSKAAEIESRRLKLHAFQRMGQLSNELRPTNGYDPGGTSGRQKGPLSLLIESGLSKTAATNVRRIHTIPPKKFKEMISRPNPPGIARAAVEGIGRAGRYYNIMGRAWRTLAGSKADIGCNFGQFNSFCRKYSAAELARGLSQDEVAMARKILTSVNEWLDEFEQYLPKKKTSGGVNTEEFKKLTSQYGELGRERNRLRATRSNAMRSGKTPDRSVTDQIKIVDQKRHKIRHRLAALHNQ